MLTKLSLGILATATSGSLSSTAPASPPRPCAEDIKACLQAANLPEIDNLFKWVTEVPLRLTVPGALSAPHGGGEVWPTSAIEEGAFGLFREVGLALVVHILDFLSLCRRQEVRCGDPQGHFSEVHGLQTALHAGVKKLVLNYEPETGVRSAVIRIGHTLQSDLARFLTGLSQLGTDAGQAVQRAAETAYIAGQRFRMLHEQLALHAWVRTLRVPGRGAPAFILHDEYLSWQDMLATLVGNIVRNGQSQLMMVEIGIPKTRDLRPLLTEFPGIQYLGVILGDPEKGNEEAFRQYEELQGQLVSFGRRARVHVTSSAAAAAALPLNAVDIAIVDAGGSAAALKEDLGLWEARVRPGALLVGRGFEPSKMEGVRVVCAWRHTWEIHMGAEGGFWWYVEPEEE